MEPGFLVNLAVYIYGEAGLVYVYLELLARVGWVLFPGHKKAMKKHKNTEQQQFFHEFIVLIG